MWSPSLPTPIFSVPALSGHELELWVKNDGASHATYGGNKIRKLLPLVEAARVRGALRLFTVGAAGSHHALSTALFARAFGLRAAAILSPQLATPHVRETLRAALGQGLQVYAAPTVFAFAQLLVREFGRGDAWIPPGASNALGAGGYADAVAELRAQIREGLAPEPDFIVVPVGSGGTCAGLLAGVIEFGLHSQVLGVSVVKNPLARGWVLHLAQQTLRRRGVRCGYARLAAQLEIDPTQVGGGYGVLSAHAERAADELAHATGLTLDSTYTAKAFAAVLAWKARLAAAPSRPSRVLYWHTLSDRPLAPLLATAPTEHELAQRFSSILLAERL